MDKSLLNISKSTEYFSRHWRHFDSLLVYISPNFQFKSDIIITELDNCMICYEPIQTIYKPVQIKIFNKQFLHKLKASEASIVIISNQINMGNLAVNFIKSKVEILLQRYFNIPIIGFFSLKPNYFMKPHTKIWQLLNAYYREYGKSNIHKTLVVSNEGGIYSVPNDRKKIWQFNDTDRAFAVNINAQYKTIDEFLNGTVSEFQWDPKIIAPNIRQLYIKELNQHTPPNIIQELLKFGKHDMYLIMIIGAPRCGKTYLAHEILKQWKNSSLAKTHAVIHLDTQIANKIRIKQCSKALQDRISVIIDGDCHTEIQRQQYIRTRPYDYTPVLCIEVNCGLQMAQVFNHVCVEEASDETTLLYKTQKFYLYKSMYQKPIENSYLRYLLYLPNINLRDTITRFRY